MFYFPELYFMNSFITLYTYIAWNITIFIYIMYTDAVYLEMKHFNENLEEVFIISQTFSSHMEQYDLGISIWGFAILSRPLILGTFSVMAMVLSVIIELTPRPPPLIEVINCTSVADTASLRS
ncbi:hypothetical protein Q1695_004090 [Nippostrongylus brasiliensis]|nr:hypothetical protein Q1695_004090 [Nippostrongylus brasiliensis]